MAVDVKTIDLNHIQHPTDIEPQPQVALGATEHYFSDFGGDAKQILLDLLESTDENEPFETRVFRRLGLNFEHVKWQEYDLYWVEGGDGAFREALEAWKRSAEMT